MRRAALMWAALAAIVACAGVATSGADFTSGSQSPANTFVTAADFNTVTVSMTNPGTPLRATVALQSTAASDRGIASVQFQSSPAGANTWTDACLATVAPYTCNWDSAGVVDGPRDLRAVAVDQAGYQRISTVVASRFVDNTLPAGTLSDPGVMQGTEALTATASDVGSGLASLAISYRPAGGSWTTLCSGATSPRTCNLNTVPLADGSYELRATATDVAGNVRDTVLTRTVDNIAPTVSVVPPATALSGLADFTLNAADAGTGVATVTAEFRPMAGGAWSQVCVDSAAPWACTGLDTTGAPDGLYEARATAVDSAGHSTTSASVTNIRVDNTAPSSATVTDPGSPFGGSKVISGTAADAGSGIASWTLQYRTSPAGAWTDACSDTSASYSCSWVTTGVADGLYDLRAIARDGAGNQTTSATVGSRRVDNTAPAVALANPGTPMTGTKALTATATDAVGVQSVSFQRSPAGAATWTQICLDATTAYTCSFDTTAVTDGSYDLRAVALDTAGNQSISTVAARVVDNPPRGVDVQTTNVGGGTAGLLQTGDTISLTWSEPILPASVLAGWTGASQAIRVSVANSASNDQMDFLTSTGAARLPLVLSATDLKLGGNFVTTAVTFNATMVRSGNTITVTLGSKIAGTLATAAVGTMTWRPSATATDASGKPSTTTTVTESGTADRDF